MLVRKAQQDQADPQKLNELYYRTARAADELGDSEKALQLLQGAPTTSTRPTCRPSSGAPTCCSRWRAGRTPARSTRPSWSSTATPRRGRCRPHLLPAGHGSPAPRRAQEGAQHVREGAGDRSARTGTRCWRSSRSRRQQNDFEAVIHAKRGLMATGEDDERVSLLDRDRRHLPREAAERAEGDQRLPRSARHRPRRSPAAPEGARPLHRDQAVEEGRRDHRALRRARARSDPQGRLLPRGRRDLPRRAEGARRGHRRTTTGRSTASSPATASCRRARSSARSSRSRTSTRS